MQLGFDTRNDGTGSYDHGVYELQIGKPDSEQAQIFKGMGCAKVGLMQGSEIEVVRDEANKLTVYEMKMPLSELDGMSGAADGKEIGYSILINDNDGGLRKGYLEWSAGIGISKDARLFGTLWLK